MHEQMSFHIYIFAFVYDLNCLCGLLGVLKLGGEVEATALLGGPEQEVIDRVCRQSEERASLLCNTRIRLSQENFPVVADPQGMLRPLPWQAARASGEKQPVWSGVVRTLQALLAEGALRAHQPGWSQNDAECVNSMEAKLGAGRHLMPYEAERARGVLWHNGVNRHHLPSAKAVKEAFRFAHCGHNELMDVFTHDRWTLQPVVVMQGSLPQPQEEVWRHSGNDMAEYSRSNSSTNDCPPNLTSVVPEAFTSEHIRNILSLGPLHTLLLRGAWGSCKTTAAIAYIVERLLSENGLRVVVVTYRVFLAAELTQKIQRAGADAILYSDSISTSMAALILPFTLMSLMPYERRWPSERISFVRVSCLIALAL